MENLNFSQQELKLLAVAAESPRKFAEIFLVNPDGVNIGQPFKANFPQKRIFASKKKNIWICVHRRAGKCLPGEMLVIDPITLRPTSIAQAEKFTKTLTFDLRTNKTVWTKSEWVYSGMKKCLKFSLGSGIELSLSDDHLVFDWKRGWVPANEIRVGDRLLAPSKIDVFGTSNPTEFEIDTALDYYLAMNKFPDEIFLYNEESIRRFFKKLWNLVGRAFFNDKSLGFMVNDRLVALDLHHLLNRCEIESRIDEDDCLFIEDPIDRANFLNLIGIPVPILDVHSPRRWEIVTEIKKVGSKPVYDLCVDHPDHNFIANDTVVHNSFSMTVLALWHAITQLDKHIVVFAPSSTQVDAFFDVIDKWIAKNPILKRFQAPVGNKQDPQRRSFITGSIIDGHILGISGSLQESRRGITADIVIVDEAQELTKKDWSVINPIMKGDKDRLGKVKGYISGTINEPDGYYFEKIYGKVEMSPNEDRIFIPITQNKDYSNEERDMIRLECTPEEWATEYMLEVGESDSAVFRKVDVDRAFRYDWDYGDPSLFKKEHIRIMGVDWDKGQAGSNIVVVQYDPLTQVMQTLWHEEVPRGEFTYTEACRRVLELFDQYEVDWVVADQGAGEKQWEDLMLAALNTGSELAGRLIKLHLGKPYTTINPQTMEEEKKQIKPFLVGLLQSKFQEGKILCPDHHFELKNQFLTYKIVARTTKTVRFNSTNEHMVDCHTFCMLPIYEFFEDPMSEDIPVSRSMRILNQETRQSFLDHDDVGAFWQSIEGDRTGMHGQVAYRTDIYNPELPFFEDFE